MTRSSTGFIILKGLIYIQGPVFFGLKIEIITLFLDKTGIYSENDRLRR